MVFGWGQDPDPEQAEAARDLYERGVSLLDAGNRDEGLEALADAAEAGGEAHTPEGYEARARALMERSRELAPDPAVEALEAAIEAARDADTPDGHALAATAALRLGARLADADRPEAAADALRRARELADQADAPGLAARAAYRLSLVREDDERALAAARDAAKRAQSVQAPLGPRLRARAHLEVARRLRGEARFAEAVEAADAARESAARVPDDEEAARLRSLANAHEALTHHDAGRRADAKQALEAAVTAGEGHGDRAERAAARAAWHLASVHAERGEDEDAADWFDRALERAGAAGEPGGAETAARIHLARAYEHRHRGDEDAAREAYSEAARLGEAAGTQDGATLAQTARSRNVQLASGLDRSVDPPSPPDPPPVDPPPLDREPGVEPLEAPTAQQPGTDDADEPEDDAVHDDADTPTPDAAAATDGASDPDTATDLADAGDDSEDHHDAGEDAVERAREAARTAASAPLDDPGPLPGARSTRAALVDRADTLRELAMARDDASRLEDAIAAVEAALDAEPRDPDLLHRRASLRATLAVWQDDAEALAEALGTFEDAFEAHGGRVDPATHQPGPNFFFDWGAATFQLARRLGDDELFEAARERLATGYEMTPRGARHLVAAAQMARCRFGLAQAREDLDAYEAVAERYEELDGRAPFALEAEDHATWARALAALAEAREDPELSRQAYERMARAYENA